MAGTAYYFLAHSLASLHGKDSALAAALGKDWKGKMSVLIYAVGIGLCFINAWLGIGMYAFVAAMWFIPDKRIEDKLITDEAA
jgi:uncharacterized membrane protein